MKNKSTLIVFAALFILAITSRFVGHYWNFTLVGAAFIFAGSYFSDKKVSYALMLLTMLVSDYFIGFHSQMISVYLGYSLMVGAGLFINSDSNRQRIAGTSLLATFAFYVVTNLGVWFEGALYPKTLAGLVDCFVMAIPFYKNQILSDVGFTLVFFELAKRVVLFPASSEVKVPEKK